MTPDRRKLLNECLAPGEGELYHTTITAFTGTKEDIEWLKAFRNGELKKRTMYQRLNLIEDARMQIEKWEAKAKRDAATPVESEPLYKCVNCDTPGFTARGIGAHAKKCKGINRSTALAPVKAIDGKAEVVPAIDLPTIRQALEAEREQLIVHEDNFEQTRLPHFLRMGLECVKAHAAFAVPDAATRGAMGGAGKSSPTVGELSTPTSFDGWLAAEVRWLSSGTAYRYRRAALGLGLTHESTPEELATLLQAARAEAGDKPLSLTQLVNRVPLTH